ncbi:DUF397 domain-containing protein [Streptomyces sp. NPDC004561]
MEWARPGFGALIRDTKDRETATVLVSAPAWQSFIGWVKRDQ